MWFWYWCITLSLGLTHFLWSHIHHHFFKIYIFWIPNSIYKISSTASKLYSLPDCHLAESSMASISSFLCYVCNSTTITSPQSSIGTKTSFMNEPIIKLSYFLLCFWIHIDIYSTSCTNMGFFFIVLNSKSSLLPFLYVGVATPKAYFGDAITDVPREKQHWIVQQHYQNLLLQPRVWLSNAHSCHHMDSSKPQ